MSISRASVRCPRFRAACIKAERRSTKGEQRQKVVVDRIGMTPGVDIPKSERVGRGVTCAVEKFLVPPEIPSRRLVGALTRFNIKKFAYGYSYGINVECNRSMTYGAPLRAESADMDRTLWRSS